MVDVHATLKSGVLEYVWTKKCWGVGEYVKGGKVLGYVFNWREKYEGVRERKLCRNRKPKYIFIRLPACSAQGWGLWQIPLQFHCRLPLVS